MENSYQSLHDFNNPPGNSGEASKYGNDFESLSRYCISELYLECHVSIVLILASKGDVDSSGMRTCNFTGDALDLPVFLLQFHAIDRQHIEDRNKQLVFVANVERMDGADIGVPSLVRLHSVHPLVPENQ